MCLTFHKTDMALDLMQFKSEIIPGLYRHYKGGLYQVFGTVTHSESEAVLVLYAPVVTKSDTQYQPRLWVRPLDMFCETVTLPEGIKPRFAYQEPARNSDCD